MKKLFLFFGIICIAFTGSFAQNRKAEKEAAAKAQFEKALAAIDAKDFVIIVDTYEASDGTIETNTDNTNFLSYEKDIVFLQGLGGVDNSNPYKMEVSDYKQIVDKKGSIKIDMQVKGSLISAKIEIFMKNGGNYADVIVSPTGGETVSQKTGGNASSSKGQVLTSRGSEAALPSVGEGFSSSHKEAYSQKNGGARRFSGEVVPRSESKYIKRSGVV